MLDNSDRPSGQSGAGAPERDFGSLSATEAGIGHALARPKTIAIACIVVLTALGWAYLGLMIAGSGGHGHAGSLGPGMGPIDHLLHGLDLGPTTQALVDALCRPSFGSSTAAWGIGDAALVLLMWMAMILAMMLPTASAMVVTYAEIADTATRKGERVVSPLILVAGYVVAWLGFAIAGTGLQAALTRVALIDPAMASASPLFSGAIFIGAAVYQFSALKRACVTRCQRPFPFFFANWTTEPGAVFRLGLRQGLYCVGCCWAMMMVMFAVGLMNIVWMAGLGIVMTVEKFVTTMTFSRLVGAVLGAIGVFVVVTAVIGHWPSHMH